MGTGMADTAASRPARATQTLEMVNIGILAAEGWGAGEGLAVLGEEVARWVCKQSFEDLRRVAGVHVWLRIAIECTARIVITGSMRELMQGVGTGQGVAIYMGRSG